MSWPTDEKSLSAICGYKYEKNVTIPLQWTLLEANWHSNPCLHQHLLYFFYGKRTENLKSFTYFPFFFIFLKQIVKSNQEWVRLTLITTVVLIYKHSLLFCKFNCPNHKKISEKNCCQHRERNSLLFICLTPTFLCCALASIFFSLIFFWPAWWILPKRRDCL